MNNISALAFDLDGTIYNGNSPVKGALDTVARLRSLNYKIFYFTNNSAKTCRQIVDKLNRLGFPAKQQNTYCASSAILTYLLEKKIKSIYLIASKELQDELAASKIKIKDSSRVSAVVVGLDPFFNYNKLAVALEAINKGAKLIVANMDPSYPIENNRRMPGSGAIVGAIAAAAMHQPDFIVGKPSAYMLKLLCKDHGLLPAEVCIVGDSPESDIAMANKLRCRSILFDPDDRFPGFLGNKVRNYCEIIPLISTIKKG